MYEFYATDRQGNVWRVVMFECETRQHGTCRVFELYPTDFLAHPLCYVRYEISEPGTGAVYWEYDYFRRTSVERVSMRRFFPGWDLRKIRKEWRWL